MNGRYKVGFSINKKENYVNEFSKNVIGAYGVTFNQRALFIYKTITRVEGFFIRKMAWLKHVINDEDTKDIVSKFKNSLKKNYEQVIKTKMLAAKNKKLAKICERNDYMQVLSLTFLNKHVEKKAIP